LISSFQSLAQPSQESFLQRQGIVASTFNLDSACNLVNSEPRLPGYSSLCILLVISAVDASLHIAMDKYAMFAVTCSEKFLDMYIDIVEAENDIWVAEHAQGNPYIRQLKVSWLSP